MASICPESFCCNVGNFIGGQHPVEQRDFIALAVEVGRAVIGSDIPWLIIYGQAVAVQRGRTGRICSDRIAGSVPDANRPCVCIRIER